MNILDIILLICFVPAIIQGLRKGFIAQAISIISIIVGIWASARFAGIATTWIAQYITASEQVLKLVAFALILVVVFLVLAALGKMLKNFHERNFGSEENRVNVPDSFLKKQEGGGPDEKSDQLDWK